MRVFWLVVFVLVAAGFALVNLTKDRDPDDGIVRLRWASDPNPTRDNQAAGFHAWYPRAKALIEPGSADKLIVQCLSGAGPDIIDIYSQSTMIAYAASGILLDLTDLAKERGFGLDQTYPALKDDLFYDGRQWRFPANVGANAIIIKSAYTMNGHRRQFTKTLEIS